jgi:hypothetical protein
VSLAEMRRYLKAQIGDPTVFHPSVLYPLYRATRPDRFDAWLAADRRERAELRRQLEVKPQSTEAVERAASMPPDFFAALTRPVSGPSRRRNAAQTAEGSQPATTPAAETIPPSTPVQVPHD